MALQTQLVSVLYALLLVITVAATISHPGPTPNLVRRSILKARDSICYPSAPQLCPDGGCVPTGSICCPGGAGLFCSAGEDCVSATPGGPIVGCCPIAGCPKAQVGYPQLYPAAGNTPTPAPSLSSTTTTSRTTSMSLSIKVSVSMSSDSATLPAQPSITTTTTASGPFPAAPTLESTSSTSTADSTPPPIVTSTTSSSSKSSPVDSITSFLSSPSSSSSSTQTSPTSSSGRPLQASGLSAAAGLESWTPMLGIVVALMFGLVGLSGCLIAVG